MESHITKFMSFLSNTVNMRSNRKVVTEYYTQIFMDSILLEACSTTLIMLVSSSITHGCVDYVVHI